MEPGECSEIFAVDEFYTAQSADFDLLPPETVTRRGLDTLETILEERGSLDRRAKGKEIKICDTHNIHIKAWNTKGVFDIFDNGNWGDCNDCGSTFHFERTPA